MKNQNLSTYTSEFEPPTAQEVDEKQKECFLLLRTRGLPPFEIARFVSKYMEPWQMRYVAEDFFAIGETATAEEMLKRAEKAETKNIIFKALAAYL